MSKNQGKQSLGLYKVAGFTMVFSFAAFAVLPISSSLAANKSEFTRWSHLLESAQKDRLCRDGLYFKNLKDAHKKKHPSKKRGLDRYRPYLLRWIPEDAEGLSVDVQTDMPVRFHPAVSKWLDYYSNGRGRENMLKWLVRASGVQHQIELELQKHGMPQDLFYLAMIESGLSHKARSRAKAKGLWQFMLPTARAFGLRVDSWTDERRSAVASTAAASRYLKKLYGRFGSWDLAMAAYNAGPGKVRSAIRRAGTKDYYKLRKTRFLRPETKEYVPKFTAALLIGKNPERYGFSVERSTGNKLATKKIGLKNAYRVRDLAKHYGASVSQFKRWNPHLLRSATPPFQKKQGEFYVYVPKTKLAVSRRFPRSVEAVKVATKATKKVARNKRALVHRVSKGDTLSAISRRYGVSQRKIKGLNPGLRARYLRPGKKIKIRI